MKLRKLSLNLVILTLVLTNIPTASAEGCFNDVSEGHPHYVAICKLKELEIIHGYNDGNFLPYQDVNRAEAVKMLTEASGFYIEPSTIDMPTTEITNDFLLSSTNDFIISSTTPAETEEAPFIDTPLYEWYTKYLIQAKEAQVIHGYDDGTFQPGLTINLVEALKIYTESLENITFPENISEILTFADVNPEAWYKEYLAYAANLGIIDITDYNPSNYVYPDRAMTRGYLAEILYRFHTSAADGSRFGLATWYGAAVQGNGTASGERFDYNLATAAHRSLPFGTMVEVTNLSNGKSVVVKINDRGPYGPGRVIDLSSSAFSQIASLGAGKAKVQYKVISQP